MELDLNIALLVILTCGVGYLMTVAGLHKGALELRRTDRKCPSCGRRIVGRVCTGCSA
jgi:ribosomal protein L37AE/L43A